MTMNTDHCRRAAEATVALAKTLGYVSPVEGQLTMANLEKMLERMAGQDMIDMPDKPNRYLGWIQAAVIAGCGGRVTGEDMKRIKAEAVLGASRQSTHLSELCQYEGDD